MKFERAVDIILSHEGGYVFNSQDPGGETNFGISKRQYPNVDIKHLSRAEAVEIYRKDYWEPIRPLLLPWRLRLCVFDCAVNQGITRAIKLLQGAVGAVQDGVLGPDTFRAIELHGEFEALENLLLLRLQHYQKLPHWDTFGRGWSKRLLSIAIQSFSGGLP